MKLSESLRTQVDQLPDHPGVYHYYNSQGELLYIGKAKSLKKRVRSYFLPSAKHNQRIALMVSLIHHLEIILTNTESEALILEAQLIRRHLPRYNVALKDDKSYPYFKLNTSEDYPRLFLVREKPNPSAEYFGPYPSTRDARYALQLINKMFLLRTSKMTLDGSKTYRPCINYQLKRCLAPCKGDVSKEDYQEVVQQVRWFLQGRYQELLVQLETDMKDASQNLEFEKAARIRDQIHAIRKTFEKRVVLTHSQDSQDVYALCREAQYAGVQALFFRHGRLLANDFFFFEDAESISDENLIGHVLNRIYMSDTCIVPKHILLPIEYSEKQPLEDYLRDREKRAVHIETPKRGHKKELVEMAHHNAEVRLQEHKHRHTSDTQVLESVQKKLHLQFLPRTVEAFDISNISGQYTVASMVAWKDNHANKANYRKFKIRTVEGSNDFASMQEVLTRCYGRRLEEEKPLPNLILIDGGKGQLSMAIQVLQNLGISLEEVDIIGLAKGRSERRRGDKRSNNEDYEYVIKPNQKNPIRLARNSDVLFFLQNIRDEAHRFAITFHRQVRKQATLKSVLEDIPGVGSKKKKDLLKHFGSLRKVKEASVEELQQAPGISEALAQSIAEYLKGG